MSLYPEIKIDSSKCTTPFDCKKCLQVCPIAVFNVEAVKVVKFRETDKKEPGTFVLSAPHRDKCIVCNRCLEVCPVDALKIILPQEVKS